MYNYFTDIKEAFKKFAGDYPEFTIPLPPTASNRLYFRLSKGDNSAIACYNTDRAENEAFLYIGQKLQEAGVNVPQIYYSDLDKNIYLQQDLGDVKLMDLVEEYRRNNSTEYLDWYKQVIDQMPAIQYQASRDFDFSKCFPREAFDKQSIVWDLNYFKYYFLKLTQVPFHEQKLEDDFRTLTKFLLEAKSDFFMFRDFQSRNIMIAENQIYFIDYQGGRRGGLQYDLASLLFEAKIGLRADERKDLLKHYLDVTGNYSFFDKEEFLRYFPAFVLIRMLQAFGAYGFRGYFERKSFFLQSIPQALENLKTLLNDFDLGIDVPHLKAALDSMLASSVFGIPTMASEKLTVSINSFSYRKGIPQDYTGNGGGFVFDCRGLPNPGRFDEYSESTGKDENVIKFLEEKPEVDEFLQHALKMISSSVSNYLERGHKHLMVNFGCTGGQHRSVYCAEKLFEYLSKQIGIAIHVNHIEQKSKSDGKKHVQK